MSLKPKSNTWKPNTDSALPLYYKDKLQKDSTVIDKLKRAIIRNRAMLGKSFILSIVVYLVLYLYSLIPSNSNPEGEVIWADRKNEVKQVFLQSWQDYTAHGWGKDVYKPVSQTGSNMGPEPLGWIIVDSLDTLMLMGCKEELKEARSWVEYELNYDFDYDVNTFETTIRMLGGLLSAYYISEDDIYLEKAVHLGNKIMGAFDSPTGIPYASVNLKTGKGKKSHTDRGASSTAEVSTLQLEFKYLAKLTGESLYWEKVEKVMEVLDSNHPTDGLVPIFVNPQSGSYQGNLIRLGSRGDSYYEYLLKQYIQTNESIYLDMYLEAFKGIKKHLYGSSYPNGLSYLGELDHGIGGGLSNKMDHLVCFIGGLFALGATEGLDVQTAKSLPTWNSFKQEQLRLGEEMAYTCYKMYHDVRATGLSPEIVVFNTDPKVLKDFTIKPLDKHNLQRPETVESLYYLYKLTGDVKYREWGYEIFQNFVKHTLVTSGGKDSKPRYTSLDDVTIDPPKKKDNMESFWLAETLKYLYLLFDDETDSKWELSNVVFNTEAHPLPIFQSDFKTGWARETPEVIAAKKQRALQQQKEKEKASQEQKAKDKASQEQKVKEKSSPEQKEKVKEETARQSEPELKLESEHKSAPKLNNGLDELEDTEDIDVKAPHRTAKLKVDKNGDVYDPSMPHEVPVEAKVPVSKPLNEQVLELENDLRMVQDETHEIIDDIQEAKIANSKNNEKVAEDLKKSGELPLAKQPVAVPLDEQLEKILEEKENVVAEPDLTSQTELELQAALAAEAETLEKIQQVEENLGVLEGDSV
ncbi:glycoside hydrolase family 47 protein [[Candida] arabinofermentans NRRL YB-2248]|uniref:alpha-1,2-Mannosidase n=1 Tax=[Candida] arabinofermentans NRRL YB-2248 TaxID=983967 RepID=A0A1E4T3W1_9ASCO|nr:glycoside hydrolase family 47 protein [[Candida] arabinofermentans NRRL YB-2248]